MEIKLFNKGKRVKEKLSNEEVKLIEELKLVKIEIESARSVFNNAKQDDDETIEYAIYLENAAMAKYLLLLTYIKKNNININPMYFVEQVAI